MTRAHGLTDPLSLRGVDYVIERINAEYQRNISLTSQDEEVKLKAALKV